jgi:hypothetical protein
VLPEHLENLDYLNLEHLEFLGNYLENLEVLEFLEIPVFLEILEFPEMLELLGSPEHLECLVLPEHLGNLDYLNLDFLEFLENYLFDLEDLEHLVFLEIPVFPEILEFLGNYSRILEDLEFLELKVLENESNI